MFSFSAKSQAALDTCHPKLQLIAKIAIHYVDFSIIYGYRDQKTQNKLYIENKTQLKYPMSKHNTIGKNAEPCARAFDFAPYPLGYKDTRAFYLICGRMQQIADQLGIKIRVGADWDGDNQTIDQTFHDYGHIELL